MRDEDGAADLTDRAFLQDLAAALVEIPEEFVLPHLVLDRQWRSDRQAVIALIAARWFTGGRNLAGIASGASTSSVLLLRRGVSGGPEWLRA